MVSFATRRRVVAKAVMNPDAAIVLIVCAERENASLMIGETDHLTVGVAPWWEKEEESEMQLTLLPTKNDHQLTKVN